MAVDEHGQHAQPVVRPVGDEVLVVEAHGAAAFDDRRGRSSNRGDPLGELVDVADRGGQADQPDVLGQVDHHLLPDRAPIGILQEVDLVEHDEAEIVQQPGPSVDHVAQHFGRHHDDRRVTVDRVVAGQQPDVGLAVHGHEISVLLVRQRLHRRGVERTPSLGSRCRDAVLGDDGLAAAGGDGDYDVLAPIERVERLVLEPVDRKRVALDEVGTQRRAVGAAGHASTGRRRTTSQPRRIARK